MGNYLNIASVSAPSEANAGDIVNISVYLTTPQSERVFAIVTANANGVVFTTDSHWVDPGVQRIFGFSFVMPEGDVTIWCWAYFWMADHWSMNPDDEYGPIVVTLGGSTPPEAEASIEDIRVNGTPKPLDLSVGDEFRVTFKARNEQTSGDIRFEAAYRVKNPNGLIVFNDNYADPAPPWTGPGNVYEFPFPRTLPLYQSSVLVNMEGAWKVDIYLYDYGTGELLDQATNVIVVNAEEVPGGTYDGEIVQPFNAQEGIRETNGNWVNPTTHPQLTQGNTMQVAYTAKNTGTLAVNIRGRATITGPSGVTYDDDDEKLGALQPNGVHQFIFPWKYDWMQHAIDVVGNYTLDLKLEIKEDGIWKIADTEHFTFIVGAENGNGNGEEPTPDVYTGRIENIKIDWGNLPGGGIPIGQVEYIPTGESINIPFEGWYDDGPSILPIRLRAELWLYGPNNEEVYHAADVSGPAYTKGTAHGFQFPPLAGAITITEEGEYRLKINLTNSSGEYLLAQYETPAGEGVPAEPAPAGVWDMMTSIMPLMMMMMLMGMMMPMMQGISGEEEEV